MSSERNRAIVIAALNGRRLSEIADDLKISRTSVRDGFIREIRQALPAELWKEGTNAGRSGTFASPSLGWLRINKDLILGFVTKKWPTVTPSGK